MNLVYIDACTIIDLAKFKAGSPFAKADEVQTARERDVWRVERLLAASRDKVIKVITSSISVAECTHLKDSNPIPDADTQRFFSELLSSGKSGFFLVQPGHVIMEKARDLRWRHQIYLGSCDSVHVATALHAGCSEFLTRDQKITQQKAKLAQLKLTVSVPNDSLLLPEKYAQDNFTY